MPMAKRSPRSTRGGAKWKTPPGIHTQIEQGDQSIKEPVPRQAFVSLEEDAPEWLPRLTVRKSDRRCSTSGKRGAALAETSSGRTPCRR